MFHDFLAADREWKSEITQYIRKIDEKASNAGRTDLATLAVWAGVILTVIGLVGTPIGIFTLREIDRVETGLNSLDAKLQREFQLGQDSIKQSVAEAEVKAREQRDDSNRRVQRLEQLDDDFTKDEMAELRLWRTGQLPGVNRVNTPK